MAAAVRLRRALAAAMLATMAPAAAADASPIEEAAAQPRPAALALARVLNSEASMVGDEKDDRKATELIQQLAAGSPDLATLEKDHPGLLRAMAAAMLPIINRSARERLPELWRRQALLYGTHFTDQQLAALIGFYTSPTGQKLINGVGEANEYKAMIAEMGASPDFKFSVDAMQRDKRATAEKVAATLDTGDQVALMTFARTGLIDRMKAIAPATQTIALRWYDEEAPWEGAATEAALAGVMTRFGIGDGK